MRAAFVLVAAHRAGREPGGPIAVSAGAIRASESFTITGIIGKDSSSRRRG